MNLVESKPFLRVPPFPGLRGADLVGSTRSVAGVARTEPADLIADLRRWKIGGDYWAKQPQLPHRPYPLVKVADPAQAAHASGDPVLIWSDGRAGLQSQAAVSGACDPWHLLQNATRVIVGADDELALITAIAGVPLATVAEMSRLLSMSSRQKAQRREAAPASICSPV